MPHERDAASFDAADIRPDIRIAAAGYFGSVLLLLVVLRLPVPGPHRGLPLESQWLTTARTSGLRCVLTAAWLPIFATPLMFTAQRIGTPRRSGRTNRADGLPPEGVADLIAGVRRRDRTVLPLDVQRLPRRLTGVRSRAVLGVR